ncbi:MAG: DUF4124 domain-containing protein [Gammaproteobacteria bacterium]|nr:DUF4124 domain-containing protein [Gammaproteobacteria bacterium]
MAGLAMAASPVGAEMYKWVDENGEVQYTQQPPPGNIKAETIKPPPKVDTEGAQKELEQQQKEVDALKENRDKRTEEVKTAADDKAFNAENCRRAQASVASFSVPNALIAQSDGSRTRITEEERLAGLKKAEDGVKEFCKK